MSFKPSSNKSCKSFAAPFSAATLPESAILLLGAVCFFFVVDFLELAFLESDYLLFAVVFFLSFTVAIIRNFSVYNLYKQQQKRYNVLL